jgi:signal transduction histidine kinase
LEISPSLIKDKKDNAIGKIITIKNISQKVEANVQAKKLMDNTSEQNKRLSNFTYIVSHNIRSNVANLDGLLSIIDLDNKKETVEHLELVKESVEKLEHTIQNLNEIINIQNNISLPMTEIEIKPMVEEIAMSVNNLLKEADIDLIINIDTKETLFTNPAYFESIILNLITNGIKYRNKDLKPFIKISYKKLNNQITFVVEDNGLGMDLEKVGDKLFGMYKTFHNNSDAKGIGLFITKSQIEALNGKVEVESEINKGTKFKITFYANN